MRTAGLQKGDEAYVSVRINKNLIADFVITAISPSEVAADMYHDPDADMVSVLEALKSALSTTDYFFQKPRLRELLDERIRQLKEENAREEGEPPFPAVDVGDIPF